MEGVIVFELEMIFSCFELRKDRQCIPRMKGTAERCRNAGDEVWRAGTSSQVKNLSFRDKLLLPYTEITIGLRFNYFYIL